MGGRKGGRDGGMEGWSEEERERERIFVVSSCVYVLDLSVSGSDLSPSLYVSLSHYLSLLSLSSTTLTPHPHTNTQTQALDAWGTSVRRQAARDVCRQKVR